MSRLIRKIIKDIKQDVSLDGNSVVISNTHTIDGHQVAPFDPSGINPLTGDEITGDASIDGSGHGNYFIIDDPNHGTPGPPPYNYNVPAPQHEQVSTVTVRRKVRSAIRDYSDEALDALNAYDVKFYAILDDGTEIEVSRNEIFDPRKPATTVSINVAQIAEAKNQHFWLDENGAHVTDDMRSSWDEEYQEANHGTLATPTLQNPWHNILLNSYGILLRKGLLNLATLTNASISFFDGTGNQESNILATFGTTGAQIGKSTGNHLVLTNNGLYAYDGQGRLIPVNASNIEADHARIGVLDTGLATANTLIAGKAEVSDLNAAKAMINKLRAITISAIQADIDNLTADEIEATDISALNAALQHLDAGTITAQELTSLTAFIGYLATSRITTNYLQANYADIGLANVNTEWLNHGMIREASISDAMIQDVSANKLTAGEIDASEIIVSNLMADNILVNRINNTPVSGASVADALMFHDRDINEINDKLNTELAALNARVDSQIETYTLNTVPTLNNEPYKNWLIYLTDSSGLNVNDSDGNPILIEDTRLDHVGDIVYVLNPGNEADGYTYRFAYDTTTSSYRWALIKDNQVTAALQRLLDAEHNIGGLEEFKTTTNTWIQQTDDGLQVIRNKHTELATNVSSVSDVANGNLKSMVQLWFTKANTTAPLPPSDAVTSTSTDGNRWTTAVPTYNPSYPNYFYCYQSQKGNGDYTWTNVVFDSAMTETQSMSRTVSDGLANYITNNNTAVSNLNDKVDGIQVGGRNLLLCSVASENNRSRVFQGLGGVSVVEIDNKTCYKIEGVGTNGSQYFDKLRTYLSANTTYTYSWWIKITTTTNDTAYSLDFTHFGHFSVVNDLSTANDKNHEDIVAKRKYKPANIPVNKWTRASLTFITNDLDNSRFGIYPKYNIGNEVTVYIYGQKLEVGNKATDWTPAPEDVSSEINAFQKSLQNQIDQQVDIWYYNAVPTLSNAPASSWTDATTKDLHLGDLYYYTDKGYAYRFIKDGSTYSWSRIKDDDIRTALDAAQDAQSTADNKRRIFTSTPTVPYDIGDLWVNGTQVKYANKARTTGSFTSSEWVLTATDDTMAKNNIKNTITIWYSKANKTAPLAPDLNTEAPITSTSTAGNAWSTVIPEYKPEYPNYFYCYQYQKGDNSYFYSPVMYNAAITEAQAKAREAVSGLGSKVDTNTYQTFVDEVDEYKRTITTLSNRVDNIQVGGRNLAKLTDMVHDPTLYNAYRYYITEPLKEDEQYTFQLWNVDVSHTGKTASQLNLWVYYCGGSVGLVGFGADLFTNGHADYLVKTITITNYIATHTSVVAVSDDKKFLNIYNSVPNADGTRNLTIGKFKLEKGNQATDWSPAPEDISHELTTVTTTANTAKQTADTNTLSITSLETVTDSLVETGTTMLERVSDIEQTLDGFNSRVSVMYSDLTSAQDRLEQLRSKYAVSTTAAGTAAKVATISSINLTDSSGGDILDSSGSALVTEQQDFILYVGVRISCKFTTANTAANPTLNVNSTGAFPIKSFIGATLEESEYKWAANSTFEFVYDGSTWKMQDSGAIKRLKAAETNISQNAEAITLRATSEEVTEKIDGIQVGGRNLAKGDEIASTSTEEWSKTCESTISSAYTEGKTYDIIRIEGEKKYVLSFEAYASSNITVNCYWYSPNTTTTAKSSTGQESTSSDGNISVTLTTSWKRYWVKWTQSDTAATLKHLIIGRQPKPSSGSTTIHIRAVKFEVGNKPTSWTPAPEDMQTVAKAQAELTVTNKNISSKVSSSDYTGTKVASLINQSADSVKIQAKHVEIDGTAIFNNTNFQTSLNGALDDIQVGGRNLLRGTANPVGGENVTIVRATVQSDNSIRLISEDAAAASAIWNVDYLPYSSYEGMTLTFSCDVKFSGVTTSCTKNRCRLLIGVSPEDRTGTFQSGTDAYDSKNHLEKVTSNWQRLSITKKIPDDLTDGNQTVLTSTGQIRVEVYLVSQAIPIDVRNFKLEVGNKATDWSPAPEDVSGDISSVYTNLNNKIDNIQVGSRNLLRGTANPVSGENVVLSRATIQTIGADKVICLTPDTSNAAAAWIIDYLPYGDYINKTLVLSADIKKADESTTYTSTGFQFYLGVSGTDHNNTVISATKDCYTSVNRSTYVTDNWIRVSAKFTIPDDFDGGVTSALVATNFLKPQIRVSGERVPVYVKNLKLEVGNESTTWTQWTPAPEDMASTTTALRRSQRIYYRTNSSTKPSAPSSWVSEASSNVYKAWTTKIPPLAASTAANATKYLYLFTCEQRETVSGAFTTTNVQLDENTTVIDGGTIITNSVTANQLNADDINASHSLTIGAFDTTSTNSLTNWYAVCSTPADTAAKLATITPATTVFSLVDGATVKVKFTITNTAAVADLTLNVNNSGYKAIRYTASGGTIANLPAASYLRESRVYDFVYDGTYWVLQYNYNSDTINRVKYEVNINAVADIAAKKIICGTALGYQPIAASVSFDLSYPLLYAQTAITAGATTGTLNNNYLKVNNISYSSNVTIDGGGANKVIYLKGTVSGTTFTIATGKFLTCKVPTSASTTRYIPLGIMSSTTAGYFDPDKEFWGYIDGSFGPASHQQSLASGKTATDYITHVDNNGIKVHAVNNATTNYSLIDGNGMKVYKGGSQIAAFGENAVIGKSTNTQLHMTSKDIYFSDVDSSEYFSVKNLKNSSNTYSVVDVFYSSGNDISSLPDGSTLTRTFYELSAEATNTSYTVKINGSVSSSGISAKSTGGIYFSSVPAGGTEIRVEYTTSTPARLYTIGTRKNNLFTGVNNYVFGENGESLGKNSVTFGESNRAASSNSFAGGKDCEAEAEESIAFGLGCYIDYKAKYSGTFGRWCGVLGISSYSFGESCRVYGSYGLSAGYNCYINQDYCIALGHRAIAGTSTITGAPTENATDCIAIGYAVIANGEYGSAAIGWDNQATGSNSVAIGEGLTAENEHMFVCGYYNSPHNQYDIFEVGNGNPSTGSRNVFAVTYSGLAYLNGSQISSDERVKSDIKELDSQEAYEFILNLKPKSYRKFYDEETGFDELGFIAQDVEKLSYGNVLVTERNECGYEDFKNLSYTGIIAPLVSTVQTLQKENEQLKQENQELENRVTELEARLARLEALVLGHLSGS